MGFKAMVISALAATSAASPLFPREGANNTHVNSNGLKFSHFNHTLPNVTIFATGGTIAGTSPDKTATTGYDSGALSISQLLNSAPQIFTKANVAALQATNVGSGDISSSLLLNITHTIHDLICADPTMSGAVVTHGTDTLEESAFFLDATVNCNKPIVFVGSMRPSTALSADGPMNLLQAVTVAADEEAKGRGAMVVMNDRIVSAFFATKTQANTMDTFKAYEMGNLGALVSDKPYFFYPAVQPNAKHFADVSRVDEVPRVDILYAYEDMKGDMLYSAVEHGAKGIVIAGAGAGGVSSSFDTAIDDIVSNRHIPVVKSHRTVNGEVPTTDLTGDTQIASGFLNPQHSRILLGLLLAEGKDMKEIRETFAKAVVA